MSKYNDYLQVEAEVRSGMTALRVIYEKLNMPAEYVTLALVGASVNEARKLGKSEAAVNKLVHSIYERKPT